VSRKPAPITATSSLDQMDVRPTHAHVSQLAFSVAIHSLPTVDTTQRPSTLAAAMELSRKRSKHVQAPRSVCLLPLDQCALSKSVSAPTVVLIAGRPYPHPATCKATLCTAAPKACSPSKLRIVHLVLAQMINALTNARARSRARR